MNTTTAPVLESFPMTMDRILVAIPCRLAPGAFSGERVFVVKLANGKTHIGLASRHFCWNADGQLVGEREPTVETDGFVAAKRIAEVEGNQVQLEVPDGKLIAVDEQEVRPRPTLIEPPLSIPKRQ